PDDRLGGPAGCGAPCDVLRHAPGPQAVHDVVDALQSSHEGRLPRAVVREAVVALHVARVLPRRPLQPAVALQALEAVSVSSLVDEAANRAPGLHAAELLSRGLAEVLARVRPGGRGE